MLTDAAQSEDVHLARHHRQSEGAGIVKREVAGHGGITGFSEQGIKVAGIDGETGQLAHLHSAPGDWHLGQLEGLGLDSDDPGDGIERV